MTGFADGRNRVARKLELVGSGEDIRGLNMGMNEAFAMKINQGIEKRLEHFASFRSRKRALRKNLRKVFFGVLHYRVEKILVSETAAAEMEQAEKIGMNELRRARPERKLEVGGRRIRGDEFDGGFFELRSGALREEDGAVFGARQKLLKREILVDDLAFTPFPDIGHIAPPTTNSCGRRTGTLPFSRCTNCKRAPWRLRQGWNAWSIDSQAPGAGRSSPTFWHEMGREGECGSYRL